MFKWVVEMLTLLSIRSEGWGTVTAQFRPSTYTKNGCFNTRSRPYRRVQSQARCRLSISDAAVQAALSSPRFR